MKLEPIKLIADPKPKEKQKDITQVPKQLLGRLAIKLYLLINLAWDYTDTVLSICSQMKSKETRDVSRQIKLLRNEYFAFQSNRTDSVYMDAEAQLACNFEECVCEDFDKLFRGLTNDINKLKLPKQEHMLVLAVEQAMTIVDACKLYARYCDRRIEERDVWTADCVMIQPAFLKAAKLIPKFAEPFTAGFTSPTRQLTAQILVNRLHKCIISNTDIVNGD